MYRNVSRLPWALTAAIAILSLHAPLSAADEPGAVRRARRLIEPDVSSVLFLAHPTGTLANTEYDGYRAKGENYVITYTFHYDSLWGNRCYTTLSFTFDGEGKYLDCKCAARKGVVPPFVAADAVLDVVKDVIRDDPDLRDNKLVREMLEETDAKEILKKYIHFKQGANDEDIKRLMKAFTGKGP